MCPQCPRDAWYVVSSRNDVGSSEGERIHSLSRRLGQSQEVLDFTERGELTPKDPMGRKAGDWGT